MRAGVPSEVPPNFWTRMGLAKRRKRSSGTKAPLAWGDAPDSACALNVALPRQPLRQENRALAGAELGVVREHDVLDPFEDRFVPDPADRDRHPLARIPVTARLWPERIRIDTQQAFRRRWQALQPVDAKAVHRRRRRGCIRWAFGADEDCLHVAITHIDPRAGAGDGEGRRFA